MSEPAATEQVIDLFGGIRPMAAKLDMPVTTVQGWKKRGIIPQARHQDILAAASRGGITLDSALLAATDPGGGRSETRAPEDIAPPSAAVPQRRRSAAAGLALTLSLLTLIGAAAAGGGAWRFYLQPLDARVTALESRPGSDQALEDLRGRVAKLEARIADSAAGGAAAAPQPAPAAPSSALDSERLSALEKQLADIKASSTESSQLAKRLSDLQAAAGGRELLTQSILDIQSATAATQGEVERLANQLAALRGRVDKVDTALAERKQQSLRAEAVMLAVGELRAALRTSAPFTKEIVSVRTLAAGDSDILAVVDQLQPFADDGAPSKDDLRTDFGHLAPQIVRSAVVGDGSTWWRQALYHIESVISIRRVGDQMKGDAVDAVVARAAEKLEEDDLKGAIAALQPLTGLAADTAAPWLHEAQERVTVDAAEAELSRLAIERVASGNAQSPRPASEGQTPSQGQPGGQTSATP